MEARSAMVEIGRVDGICLLFQDPGLDFESGLLSQETPPDTWMGSIAPITTLRTPASTTAGEQEA